MILPSEIMLEIYNYSNVETRIKLNRALSWSYYTKNPFYNIKNGNIEFKKIVTETNFPRYASYKGITIILPS